MCKFCDVLYSEKQADNKLHQKGAADLVYFDDDGELNIQVDTGDPWESGILSNITFCPYCGRNLKESKCCPWFDMCIYKTATCRVQYPDEGCVLYRWFKELISKENEDGIQNEK